MRIEEIRKELHKIPEVGFKEYKTKNFIKNYLKYFNCEIIEFGETGIIASFNKNKKISICFRCEEDGLPINELNSLDFKSRHEGYMHACGHDGHMAILLKLGEYINSNLKKIDYNVILIFQPSEETYGGSKSLMDSNILQKKNIKAFYGMHIWPNLDKGKIYSSYDKILAKSIEFDLVIEGLSEHIGNLKDNKIFDVLERILNRIKFIDKQIQGEHKIGLGYINGGKQRNISPNEIILKGSIRVFDDNDGLEIIGLLKKEIASIAIEENAFIKLIINDDYYVIKNNANLVKLIKNNVDINILDKVFYQGEDFGLYSQYFKTVYFLLGGGPISSLHSETFNFEMNILNRGLNFYKKLIHLKY